MTDVVQHPHVLGMDCKWVLSFTYRLCCIYWLLYLRWHRIKRANIRSLGMGNNPLHGNVIDRPWQSWSYHKVSSFFNSANPSLWTKWTIFAIPGSFVIYMVFLPVYAIVAPILGFSEEYFGILPHLYPTVLFWASIVVIPVLCLMRDFAWK
jgi:hypothetical protein